MNRRVILDFVQVVARANKLHQGEALNNHNHNTVMEKLIRVREHSCPLCKHMDDRDLNAAEETLNRRQNNQEQGPS